MGSDDLHRRRKFEPPRGRIQRVAAVRILIVCEGQTEEGYFRSIRPANSGIVSEITSDCGTSPICVVDCAIEKANEDGDFDEVYAVFDGDGEQSNFNTACEKVALGLGSTLFFAITSIPCFEYWYLCHFDYSRKPYLGNIGSNSSCDILIKDLRRKNGMNGYKKGLNVTYPILFSKTQDAIRNSKLSLDDADRTGEVNPSTNVCRLVGRIISNAD